MSEGGETKDIGRLDAPYRREVVFQDVQHESGMRMLRIRIREGRRFTIIDIDEPTAEAWADLLTKWRCGELASGAPGDGAPAPEGHG